MKNECSIVKDLLPLYIEKMVSEDTACFVEEHLKDCTECREICESLKAPAMIDEIAEEKSDPTPLVKLKKKLRRKKIITAGVSVILAAAILLALFAVSVEHFSEWYSQNGSVVEVVTDDGGKISSFVIETEEGKKTGILVTDETYAFSFADGTVADRFWEGELTDAEVSVEYKPYRKTLITGDGEKIKAYEARSINISGFFTGETETLSDGTVTEVWRYHTYDSYVLPDGTPLIYDRTSTGPEYVIVAGVEQFENLAVEVKEKILQYYEAQGLLFNKEKILEMAYNSYLAEEEPAYFKPYSVGQETWLSAANERVLYFETIVWEPIDQQKGTERRIGTAFDRETGELIENTALLACTPEEAIEKIMDITGIEDETLRKEMAEAFAPERLVFSPDGMYVVFEDGTLPSEEFGSWWIDVPYDEKVLEVLNDWAIPANTAYAG